MEVTNEVYDGRMLKNLVDNASENNKVKRVLADGMYDYQSSHVKVRSTTNCHTRNMFVLRQQTNLKRWKRSVGYGQRWMVETISSRVKRIFSEYVNARKFHNMTKELIIKASLYNMIVAIKV